MGSHSKVYAALKDEVSASMLRLDCIFDEHVDISLDSMGIDPIYESANFSAAQRELALLESSRCVYDKHQRLRLAIDALAAAMNDVKPMTLTADDLIPLLSYLVVKGRLRHVPAALAFLQHFDTAGNAHVEHAENKYRTVTLNAVVQYLLGGGVFGLKADAEQPKAVLQTSTARPVVVSQRTETKKNATSSQNEDIVLPELVSRTASADDVGPLLRDLAFY